ncbi:MAG: carboxypeptidase regulatory-like domain-containing protein [Haloplanus sp.]
MSRVAPFLGVLLILSLVAGPSGVIAQSDRTVTVTVAVRDRAGNPVDGADLDVTWDGGSTTATTAGNGKAFVDVPAGARVTVAVNHPQYVRTDPYVISDASERAVEVTVYRKSSIRLEVSGPDGPIAGASVLVERGGLDVATGTTNDRGVFESSVIRAGDYSITVTKSGYYTRRKPLSVEGDVTNRVALRPGTVDVTVRVVDPHFDPATPVAGANVTLDGIATEHTGRSGNVTVDAPVNTRTTLRVTRPGYRSVTRELRINETNTTVSVGLSRPPSLSLRVVSSRMVAGERILVTATDAYGDPVVGARVTLDGERVGTTDTDGELAVRIEEPGTHTLQAATSDRTSNEVQIEAIAPDRDVTGTPTETVDPSPTASATVTPTPTPTATGLVSPGFTPALAVLAILGAALLFRRR